MHVSAFFLSTVAIALLDIGRSLRQAFFMLWQTLWALVLGSSLSGVIQTFVSRKEMERVLGNHRPVALLWATGLGTVSSSCSYAAAAVTRTLFAKGADFISALAFMVASTNLVIELGVVLVVLLGWPFLAAELAGAPMMIAALALGGALLVPGRMTDAARQRAMSALAAGGDGHHDGHHSAHEGADPSGRWRHRLRQRSSWAEAARRSFVELYTVRRELFIGFLVAGFLATLIPSSVWNAAFVHGHGAWSDTENAAVAPIIAFASFVCSIGNVPLAAALWHGGIAFGGVASFVLADLLAAPLVLIYRRYYGTALALRVVALLWASMVVAGLAVQALFSSLGVVPTERPAQVVPLSVRLDLTSVLDGLALVALAALWWTSRRRANPGHGVAARVGSSPPVATRP